MLLQARPAPKKHAKSEQMEPSLAAVKTFTAGAAKADASARSSIQQSSQMLGPVHRGLSRLALSARAAAHPIPSAHIQTCCVIYIK